MRLAVLGPVEAARGEAIVERPAHRRLLAILVQAGEPLTPEQLAERFWAAGDRPQGWKASLQTHVSAVRRLLGAGTIVLQGKRYGLDLDGHELDLDEFTASVDAVRRAWRDGRWDEVVEAADDALRLWRGEPFAELADDGFALPDIVHLRERHLETTERRAEALLQLGRPDEALPDLEAVALDHPLREHLWELLIVARARTGRTAEALDAHRELRARMAELGLDPNPHLRELETRILREDPTLVARPVRHNLPPARTSFVGREHERAELATLLAEHRLVTLTGVGGAGKTRLAQVVARDVLDRHPDGVHLVELAPVTDPAMVPTAVAAAFGLRPDADPVEALRTALRHRTALCVLDNCEHLGEAAADVARLVLDAGPGMRVLATSRAPLGLPEELRFEVPPLPVPAEHATSEEMARSPAVRLLLDRARLLRRDAPVGDDVPWLGELCRRLDGLPLAIELAAARTTTMAPEAVVERLRHSLDLLATDGGGVEGRHRTLETTIAWSHELLTRIQQVVLARLSAFAGSFSLEAAEAVCADAELTSDAVGVAVVALVDRSLVATFRTPAGAFRYRLLETIRTFAKERLGELDPGPDELAARHLDWAAAMARTVTADLDRPDQLATLDRLEADRDNLMLAHERAVARGDTDAAVALGTALGWFWSKRGHWGRAIAHLEDAIAAIEESDDPEREADLRSRLAGLHYTVSREQDALREATRARDLLLDAPPSTARVRALTEHASIHMRVVQQDLPVAIASATAAVDAAAGIDDRVAQAHALRTLGTALTRSDRPDDVAAGIDRLREALDVARALGHDSEILGAYLGLFISLLELPEDPVGAMRVADDALDWIDRGGDRLAGSSSLLMWIAYGAVKAGHLDRADASIERSARYPVVGALRMSYLTVRALLHWTCGELDAASAKITQLRAMPVASRYYRIVYPLEAEVAALADRPELVHHLAERHEDEDVIDVEQPLKVGTLWPALRVEVDAALAAGDRDREDHAARARSVLDRMRTWLDRFPPSPPSGLRFEMPATYLALAEAEVTRLAASDPEAWRRAVASASYLYWATYARARLAEALIAVGDPAAGAEVLRRAHRDADRLASPQLRRQVAAVADEAGLHLDEAPVTPRG